MFLEGLHEKEIFTENYPFRMALNTSENFDYPFHWHNAIELVYALENSYEVLVNNSKYHLNEKDILFIASGDIHGIQTKGNKGKRVFIQFDVSMLDGFISSNVIKPFLSVTRKVTPGENTDLHKSLENQLKIIMDEYQNKEFAYALSLNARIYDIIVLLSRSLINKVDIEKPGVGTKRVYGLEKLDRTFKYIEENFQNNITLRDAAKASGFSEYHFSRIFKEITEKNFHDYLNEIRLRKAEKLLMEGSTTIAEAAHASGFNSLATFNRLFKEVKGCTPSEYKKLFV